MARVWSSLSVTHAVDIEHISTAGPTGGHQKIVVLLTWIKHKHFMWVPILLKLLVIISQRKIMSN